MTAGVAFPYALGPGGRTACASAGDFLKQVLEQILLAEPGERVNRPDFGCALSPSLFSSGKDATSTAVEAMIHSALEHWSGPAIQVKGVDVAAAPERTVKVTIRYLEVKTGRLLETAVSAP